MNWPEWGYWALACIATWLLYRMYTVLKAIHFMIQKDFDQKWLKPLEAPHED